MTHRPFLGSQTRDARDARDEGAHAASDESRRDSPATVLIVEDNPANMRLFHDLLTFHGYEVKQAWDGEEGYAMACECNPDLILMDIQLPKASGLEAIKRIKEVESLRSVPVIAVTAFAMKGDAEKMREAGCDTYLSKPVSLTRLMETVERYLDAAPALEPRRP